MSQPCTCSHPSDACSACLRVNAVNAVQTITMLTAERDAARAELAAANTRCADARCVCGCTWDNHEGVRCTSHESCLGFRADRGEGWASYAAEQERNAALQATLDRVTAEVARMEHESGGWVLREWWDAYYRLRAALTPEGTE